MNLFLGAFFISIVKSINDPFTHRHSDAIAVIFAESCCFRHAQTHFLREIHALDLRLQCNFHMLGVLGHARASPAPNWPRCGRLMGNIGTETESMEQRPESGFVIPVQDGRQSLATPSTSGLRSCIEWLRSDAEARCFPPCPDLQSCARLSKCDHALAPIGPVV